MSSFDIMKKCMLKASHRQKKQTLFLRHGIKVLPTHSLTHSITRSLRYSALLFLFRWIHCYNICTMCNESHRIFWPWVIPYTCEKKNIMTEWTNARRTIGKRTGKFAISTTNRASDVGFSCFFHLHFTCSLPLRIFAKLFTLIKKEQNQNWRNFAGEHREREKKKSSTRHTTKLAEMHKERSTKRYANAY